MVRDKIYIADTGVLYLQTHVLLISVNKMETEIMALCYFILCYDMVKTFYLALSSSSLICIGISL